MALASLAFAGVIHLNLNQANLTFYQQFAFQASGFVCRLLSRGFDDAASRGKRNTNLFLCYVQSPAKSMP
jgi:hypothetical protein